MNTQHESNDASTHDDEVNESAEQFQPTIKELEESVWQASRGPGTKAVAWLILIGLAACLIGLVIVMVVSATN